MKGEINEGDHAVSEGKETRPKYGQKYAKCRNIPLLWETRVVITKEHRILAPCGLRGCENRPTPFPDRR